MIMMNRSSPEQKLCDFCNEVILGDGVSFPCGNCDYDGADYGVGENVTLRTEGDWIACDNCAALVRDGDRSGLVWRSAKRLSRVVPEIRSALRSGETTIPELVGTLGRIHAPFWYQREKVGKQ